MLKHVQDQDSGAPIQTNAVKTMEYMYVCVTGAPEFIFLVNWDHL